MLVQVYHTNPSFRGEKRDLVFLNVTEVFQSQEGTVKPYSGDNPGDYEDEYKGIVLDYLNAQDQFKTRVAFDLDFLSFPKN
jgi:hypothetical protein